MGDSDRRTNGNLGVQRNILYLMGQQHLPEKGRTLSMSGTAHWCEEHRLGPSPARASHRSRAEDYIYKSGISKRSRGGIVMQEREARAVGHV